MARNPRSDMLKAASIFGVVFIHLSPALSKPKSVFRFGVPVFVVLWSLYYESSLARSQPFRQWSSVRTRLVRLAIPYLFWTVVYLVLYHGSLEQWQATPWHTVVGGWFGGYGWPGQYFFIVLLQMTVLIPWLRRYFGPGVLWATLGMGLICYAGLEFRFWRIPLVSGVGDRLFVYWLPYVALGIGLSRGILPKFPVVLMSVLAVVALAFAPWESWWTSHQLPRASPYILTSIYLGSMSLVLATGDLRGTAPGEFQFGPTRLSARLARRFGSVVEYLGRNTFPIFVTNPLVIHVLPRWMGDSWGSGWVGDLKSAGLTMVVIVACLGLGWMFRRLRLGILVGG